MNQYQCQASVGFWPNYIGIILTLFPFAIAYLLNVRPKSELDQLPEIVDERIHLKSAFGIFVRILIVAVPMIGLTYNNNPAAKAYGAICAVLGLPLACCYHIAYVKLNTTKSNISKQQQRRMSGGSTTGGDEEGPLFVDRRGNRARMSKYNSQFQDLVEDARERFPKVFSEKALLEDYNLRRSMRRGCQSSSSLTQSSQSSSSLHIF